MKKSFTLKQIYSSKLASSSPSYRANRPPALITSLELKNEELLSQRFKAPVQSCKSNKKPSLLKPSKSCLPQSSRISPKSNSTPISHNIIKPTANDTKARPTVLKSLIRVKQMMPKEIKTKPKASIKDCVIQLNRDVYDFPEQLLTNKEVKQRHEEIHKAHLFQTFQGLKLAQSIKTAGLQEQSRPIDLPIFPRFGKRKTVVFDLDETLVHCVEGQKGDADILVKLDDGQLLVVGINIRPYARECLAAASKDFEVIVFTASHKSYADAVLDYLDPKGKCIHYRLYRENCALVNGTYVKDLRILNRDIDKIVIVDNNVQSFAFHIDNGVPIISWHNDRYDKELFKLIDYLKLLAGSADIKETNRQTFKLEKFFKDFN